MKLESHKSRRKKRQLQLSLAIIIVIISQVFSVSVKSIKDQKSPILISPTIVKRPNPVKSIQHSPYITHGLAGSTLLPYPHPYPPGMPIAAPSPVMAGPPISSIPAPRFHNLCPCASSVRCLPCGILRSAYPRPDCPCAPTPVCPKCPPLSVIHEVASRKALQDQRLASELQNLSNAMTKLFKNISKFAGEVVKFEIEAKDASLRMEEASLKAQFSRAEMERTSEKARSIAKNTLIHPCVVNCADVPSSPGEILGMQPGTILGNFIDDSKIFPQEVDSIGDYMKDTYSTNINGYNARDREVLNNNRLETESEGSITVEPLGEQEIEGVKNVSSNQKDNKDKE